ncbi:hypothetical protein GMST_23340 [Geomonas silvestris]|uniref:Uncharacterized protein n=1 Tax=Geomonas silvestris TaxID=2740184 RepID=A0A6V8MJY4_9BACT|nr:hypothetical protein GMST_23340 [Geomonas silvestris]
MVVRARGAFSGEDAQVAGHAEVQQQRPDPAGEDEILAAALHGIDVLPGEQACEFRRNHGAEFGAVYQDTGNRRADDMRGNAEAGYFYLR